MIGKHLKMARIDKGLTQKELALALGFTESTISAWENQVRSPSYKDLMRLCVFFDMTVEDFFHGKSGQKPVDSKEQAAWTFGVDYTMLTGPSFAAQKELVIILMILSVIAVATGWTAVIYLSLGIAILRVLLAFYYLFSIDRKKVMVNYAITEKPLLVYTGAEKTLEHNNEQQLFLMFFGMMLVAFGVLFFSVHIDQYTSSGIFKWFLIGVGTVTLIFEVHTSSRFFDTFGDAYYDLTEVKDPLSMTHQDLSVVLSTIVTAVFFGTMLMNVSDVIDYDMIAVIVFIGMHDLFRIELHKMIKSLKMTYVLKIEEQKHQKKS
jgi:transcriptional regulator with XRE-family HTH domain